MLLNTKNYLRAGNDTGGNDHTFHNQNGKKGKKTHIFAQC